jgi:hypothetical protein
MRPVQRAPGQLSGQKRRSGLPPPPDPENASPGAVATATGAEIQTSVLRRTTSQYRNRHAYVQSAASAALAGCNEQDRTGSVAEYDGKRHARDVAPRTGTRTPLRGIRQNCLWCCNGSAHEVAVCAAEACPTWPFRFGHKPTDEIIADQRDTLLHPLEWRITAPRSQPALLVPLTLVVLREAANDGRIIRRKGEVAGRST